jgi:hypothetical protein
MIHRFVLALLSVLPLPCAAQTSVRCPQDYLQLEALKQITETKTVTSADAAFAAVIAPDAVTRLVYASHRSMIKPGAKSDEALIAALPQDEVTWSLLYSLTHPNLARVNQETAAIASGRWLSEVSAAVLRRGHGARQFLLQAYLGSSNADISEMFDDLYSEFRAKNPKAFWAAHKSLPHAARAQVPTD